MFLLEINCDWVCEIVKEIYTTYKTNILRALIKDCYIKGKLKLKIQAIRI